jgi:hypothetical protein
MASITLRTDDMTGETLPDDTPTTTITVTDPRGSISVEVDLSDTSFKGLQKALDKIVSKSRPVTPPAPRKLGDNHTEAAEARAWAIATRPDLSVKEKGAVPKAAIVAYRAYLDNQTEDESIKAEVRAVGGDLPNE